jgi:hypothetical protein
MADQVTWLVNFCNKLPGYAAALGITVAQKNAAVADACWVTYILESWLPAVRAWSQACSAASLEAQSGDPTVLMTLPVFTAPALPVGVVPVNKGALDRLFAFIQMLKDSGKVTEAIGTDLRIIGTEMTGPDLATLQATIKLKASVGGVFVDWSWGGNGAFLDMIEIQVDRNDGHGFVFLANDTTPGYNDTAPFPAAVAKWTYRAIYRVDDARVEQPGECGGGGITRPRRIQNFRPLDSCDDRGRRPDIRKTKNKTNAHENISYRAGYIGRLSHPTPCWSSRRTSHQRCGLGEEDRKNS